MQGQHDKIMSFWTWEQINFFYAKHVCFWKYKQQHSHMEWQVVLSRKSPVLLTFLEKITHFYFLFCYSKHLIIWNNVWSTPDFNKLHTLFCLCLVYFKWRPSRFPKKNFPLLPRIPWLVAPSCFIHRLRKKRGDSQSDSNGKGRESFDSSSCITVRSVEATVRTEIYASASSMMDVSLLDC